VKRIPPGGEGIIKLKVDTDGYGGQKISEQAKIYTNGPMNRPIVVTIKGTVEQFATVSPKMIRLVGALGKTVVTRVTIEKRAEYPFKIVGIRAWDGKYIRYTLDELTDSTRNGYLLTVECLKKTKGQFADTLYLETDSSIYPEISIVVLGNIYKG
jgi:hypothetical protein